MNLISKVCVLFLVWVLLGGLSYLAMMVGYLWKAWKLAYGKSNAGDFVDEYFGTVFRYAAGCRYTKCDSDDDGDSFGEYFVIFFLVGLLWPYVISRALPACEEAYKDMVEKYGNKSAEGLS